MRALPARGREGSIPFAGRVPQATAQRHPGDVPTHPAGMPSQQGAGGPDDAAQQPQRQQQRGQQAQGEGGELAGQGQQQAGSAPGNWWVIGGLGARGLVYHAWLGRLVAEAMTKDDEALLLPELLRWRDE